MVDDIRLCVGSRGKGNRFLSLLCHFENINEQTPEIDRAPIGYCPADRRNQRQQKSRNTNPEDEPPLVLVVVQGAPL